MHLLVVEDRPEDRELIVRQLQRHLEDVQLTEVSGLDSWRQALGRGPFDLILTDYQLNWANGLQVLQEAQSRFPGVPVVMFTDTGDEQVAVEGMHAGLSDYLLKKHLDRLPVAVQSSLERADLQRQAAQAAQELRQAEGRYRLISELISDYAYTLRINEDRTIELEWSTGALAHITAYTAEEIDPHGPLLQIVLSGDQPLLRAHRDRLLAGQEGTCELRIRTRDDEVRWLRITERPEWDEAAGRVVRLYGAAQDVTAQRTAEEALRRANEELETRVAARTADLSAANQALARQAEEVEAQAEELQQQTEELEQQNEELEVQAEELRQQTEEIQAQAEAVKESEIRFRMLAEHTWDWEFWMDADQRLIYVSPSCQRVSGYTAKELIRFPKLLWQMVHPQDIAAFRQVLERALEGQAESGFDYRLLRKDGRVTWVSLACRAVTDAAGNQGVRGSVRDIDERKQAEQEAQLQRQLLETIVKQTPAGILLIQGPDLRIQLANPAYQAIAPGKDLPDRTMREVWAEIFPFLGEICHQVLATGEPYYAVDDKLLIRRSEKGPLEPVYFTWSLSRIRLPGDHGWGLLNTVWETTQRKRTEEELREAKEQLELTQRAAGAGAWDWDVTTGQLKWSAEMFALFGLDSRTAEASLESWRSTLHLQDREVSERRIEEALQSHTNLVNEYRILWPNGQVRWVCDLGRGFYDEQGRPVRMSGICLDITPRKQAELEREQLLQEVARTRDTLQTLVDSLAEGVVVFDAEGRVVQANPAELAQLGGTLPADRQSALELLAYRRQPDGPAITIDELPSSRALRGEIVVNERFWVSAPNGRRLIILSSAAPLKQDGQIVGAVATHSDVTELEQARELSEARNRINAHVSSSPNVEIAMQQVLQEAVQALDVDAGAFLQHEGNRWVLRQSEGMPEKLLGYTIPEEETDVAAWIIEHRDVLVIDDLDARPNLKLPLARPYGLRSLMVIPLLVQDRVMGAVMLGRRSSAARSSSLQVDFARKLGSLLSLAMENARLYEQARQDAEAKATLLREVNHRVKNNLGAIIGLLYAQMERPGETPSPEYYSAIREVTQRIEGLSVVHKLLSSSHWTPLRLDELAGKIVDSTLQAVPVNRVSVEVQPSPTLVSPDQAHTLALVINELALNVGKHALKADAAVHVTVSTAQQDDKIVLLFRDNGPGYPGAVVAGQQVGVGLGLLRNLVRQNLRGQMVLRNEGGAVTEISFPAGE